MVIKSGHWFWILLGEEFLFQFLGTQPNKVVVVRMIHYLLVHKEQSVALHDISSAWVKHFVIWSIAISYFPIMFVASWIRTSCISLSTSIFLPLWVSSCHIDPCNKFCGKSHLSLIWKSWSTWYPFIHACLSSR